jgi:transposase
MNYVGIDLHKKTITIHVVNQERKKVDHKRLYCQPAQPIVDYFKKLGPFQAVIEATASYEWLVRLLEPLADRIVLAHPQKLRIIAESTRKSDKVDAQVLAEFLALDMIPQAYRPTPRQREHRVLVRHRCTRPANDLVGASVKVWISELTEVEHVRRDFWCFAC